MRTKLLAMISIVALVLAACGGTDTATDDGDATTTTAAAGDGPEVVLSDIAFEPSEIEVEPGTTITFTHEDGGIPHTVTAEDGSFDSGQMGDGDQFTVTVEESGEIPFFCEIHPSQMQGTITVSDG